MGSNLCPAPSCGSCTASAASAVGSYAPGTMSQSRCLRATHRDRWMTICVKDEGTRCQHEQAIGHPCVHGCTLAAGEVWMVAILATMQQPIQHMH